MNRRVLHISCGGLGYGGVSSVILSIVESLHGSFDFGCVVFNSKGGRENIFKKYGELYRINAYSINGKRRITEILFRSFRLYFGIKRVCKENNYDVVHCHNNSEEGICLMAAKHAGVPIRIAHSHNTPSTRKRALLFRIIEKINKKMIQQNATLFVGCSNAACASFFGNSPYKVIYNAIDFSNYTIDQKSLNERNGKTFIHVGRYTYQKNQEFVIRVFKHLLAKDNTFKLLLIGYGEDESMLRNLTKELNIVESVMFIDGKEADITSYYKIADYMIFPSRYEGFGIVLLEAQSMRIHCFVSEAIQQEADAGLLTRLSLRQEPEEWANTIVDVISRMPKINYSILQEKLDKYSSTSVAREYEELYRGT